MKYKYIFGPVNSRRLGVSLGIDVLPYKVCSYDCVYCECGLTTELLSERKSFFPASDIIKELNDYLKNSPKLDFITFSGSGEPTLYSGLGEVIKFIKNNFSDYRVAVLTNSSLINREDVQKDLLSADLVIPSIDSVTTKGFEKIVKPDYSLDLDSILKGLLDFREKYNGRIVVEIFLVKGINDTEYEILELKKYLERLNADGIQLNSLDRPAPIDWVKGYTINEIEEISRKFLPLKTQIVYRKKRNEKGEKNRVDINSVIIEILLRRPSTLDDLVYTIGIGHEELKNILDILLLKEKITLIKHSNENFYKILN